MAMNDLETTEHEKTLASIIEADPHPRESALGLVYFGLVTAELDPVVFHLDHGIGHPDFAGEAWLTDDYLPRALEMGGMLAVQKFGIDPAGFPGRLVVFWDFATKFIPVMSVAGRLITWGSQAHKFYATDQPAPPLRRRMDRE
jgi:hypothetical protein